MNMGPTGARGILKERSYLVMLDNGPVNTAAWQTNTKNSFSHKTCLGYLVYKLFPERSGAATGMKLHLSNIETSRKDMADGHARALMGFTWGLAGVFASDSTKLKKKFHALQSRSIY